MIKWLQKFFPSKQSMQNSPQVKGLKAIFKNANCWSRDHQCVARGVAAGLAGSVIPGFQFFYAALLAIILRGNLPIALVFTFVSNPLTVAPLTYFIYFIGTLILGNGNTNIELKNLEWDFSSFHAFWTNFSAWILQFSKAFLVGLPIMSLAMGLIGYVGTNLLWKGYDVFKKKRKSKGS